jgi:glycosyltransferase involved in cell wall biosynthesis
VRIALVGTRGIPANYGGFETFAEELSTRLVERGHEVTVYCRRAHAGQVYRGVRLQYLPTIRHKYFDTIAHTALSTWHLLRHRPDVALYCNGANAIFTPWPRMLGVAVALNVDGIERKRKKWNRAARAWYFASEWLSKFCPTVVVTDARTIQQYYRERWDKDSVFIPYGAETGKVASVEVLKDLGLQEGRYFLYVSRLEPENHPLEVRESFEQVVTRMKLALVGDAPYAEEYIRQVRDTTDPRVVMPGAIYGTGYQELGSHCFAYIHATEVGGTHPALIEAMGRGALIIYRNTPENAEVVGDTGIPYEPGDLPAALRHVLAMPEFDRARLRRAAIERVREEYSWDAVTTAYEELLTKLCGAKGGELGVRREESGVRS